MKSLYSNKQLKLGKSVIFILTLSQKTVLSREFLFDPPTFCNFFVKYVPKIFFLTLRDFSMLDGSDILFSFWEKIHFFFSTFFQKTKQNAKKKKQFPCVFFFCIFAPKRQKMPLNQGFFSKTKEIPLFSVSFCFGKKMSKKLFCFQKLKQHVLVSLNMPEPYPEVRPSGCG